MPPATEISRETGVADPPRFRWLRRISIAVAMVLVGLALMRLQWSRAAEARLRAIVDAAHARGEPILLQDFGPQSILANENAALTLRAAADAIVTDANSDWMGTTWTGDALTPAEVRRVDVIAANNTKPLRLVRLARSQPRSDWGLVLRSPVQNNLSLSHFQPQRELAKLQEWVALRDHAKGNDAEALNRVLDLLRQSDAIEQGTSLIVTHLVGIGLQALTATIIHEIAPDLRIGTDSTAPTSAGGAATQGQVRAVVDALLDERAFRAGAIRAWEGERMSMLDAAQDVADGKDRLAPQPLAWLTRPMFVLDGNRMANDLTQARDAAGLSDWPSARAALPVPPGRHDFELERIPHLLSDALGFSTSRLMQLHFQVLGERRAAAIELAIRAYRVEHSGRWPDQLSALVPEYLPAVPADPMAAGGRPFGYRPAASPPVIYSVGANGIDDGGTGLPRRNVDRWNLADAVFPLAPPPPPPPLTSTQPTSTEAQQDQ